MSTEYSVGLFRTPLEIVKAAFIQSNGGTGTHDLPGPLVEMTIRNGSSPSLSKSLLE